MMAEGSGSIPTIRCSSGWPDLPTEILDSILSRLPRLDDRTRFSAVCKPWASAWAHQPPSTWTWMVEPDPDGEIWVLFSLSDRTFYARHSPPGTHGASIAGSFDSWLVMVPHRPDHRIFLLNPFSTVQIPLPHQPAIIRPVRTEMLDGFFPIDARESIKNDYLWRKDRFIRKAAILSSSPASDHTSLIVAALGDCHRLSICRPHWTRWASLPHDKRFIFWDIIFYQGLLHAVNYDGELYTIEVGDNGHRIAAASVKGLGVRRNCTDDYKSTIYIYLVESRGRLLMVLKYWRTVLPVDLNGSGFTTTGFTTTGFEVFELHSGAPPRWVEVKSLGGHALFIGTSCSKSVPAAQCVGAEEDCIYFTDDCHGYQQIFFGQKFSCLDSGVFSMKDGSITVLLPNLSKPSPLWLHYMHA